MRYPPAEKYVTNSYMMKNITEYCQYFPNLLCCIFANTNVCGIILSFVSLFPSDTAYSNVTASLPYCAHFCPFFSLNPHN